MSAAPPPPAPVWPTPGTHRIPFGVYNSAELHRMELESLGMSPTAAPTSDDAIDVRFVDSESDSDDE